MQYLKILKQQQWFNHKLLNIFALLLFAFILRILITLPGIQNAPQHFCRPDSAGYIQPAIAIATDGGFYSAPGTFIKQTARPPLFPLFLSCFFYCFGENYVIPIIALCLVGALTCVPIYMTGKLFGGDKTGMLAAFFFALNITAISSSPMLLTDAFFAFFTAWQLYFFSLAYLRKDLTWVYFGILFAAIAVLIRPIGVLWYIPGIFLIIIMPGILFKRKFTAALICLCIFWSVVFPWMWRNQLAGAGYCVDTNTGAMYHQNGAMLLAKLNNTSYEDEKQRILKELEVEFADHQKYPDEKSRVDYRLSKLKELILQNPVSYLRLHFNPQIMLPDVPMFCELLGFTKSDRGTLDVMQRYGIFAAIQHYFQGIFWLPLLLMPVLLVVAICYLGVIIEMVIWLRDKQFFLFFFFLAFVEYYLFLPGPITVPRYQMPALPLIVVMGALGCISLLNYLKVMFKKKISD